jgi:hypothetical protein
MEWGMRRPPQNYGVDARALEALDLGWAQPEVAERVAGIQFGFRGNQRRSGPWPRSRHGIQAEMTAPLPRLSAGRGGKMRCVPVASPGGGTGWRGA